MGKAATGWARHNAPPARASVAGRVVLRPPGPILGKGVDRRHQGLTGSVKPPEEVKVLAWSLALFLFKVVGGALVLTGVWLGLLGLAHDEMVLSKVLLVCSPRERAVLAQLGSYNDRELDPEPHFATGSCEARVQFSGSPRRVRNAFAAKLRVDGWEVRESTDGIGDHLRRSYVGERSLLTATHNGFYCELAYLSLGDAGGSRTPSATLRLSKL